MIKQLLALAAAVLLILPLSACGKSSENLFFYSVSGGVGTLDPQFATNTTSQMVIANTFEGLMVQTADGDMEPGVAESMKLSADGKTYSFYLRKNAKWSDGEAVTAKDFEFALKRLFGLQALSPFANNLNAVKNAKEILAGEMSAENLAVQAVDDFTLIIELAYPDPSIPSALCQPYAAPCRESYFDAQKGRYGVDAKSTIYNGPFVIDKLNNTKSISLKPNSHYVSDRDVLADGVIITLNDSKALDKFLKGDNHVVKVDNSKLNSLKDSKLISFNDTTWVLVYNQKREHLADLAVRRGLSSAVNRENMKPLLTEGMATTGNLVPEVAFVGSEGYRKLAGDLEKTNGFSDVILEEYKNAPTKTEQGKLPLTELIVPDSDVMRKLAGTVQGDWQRELNAYINVMPLEEPLLQKRVKSGDYDIALIPILMQETTAQSLLSEFTAAHGGNIAAYQSEEYEQLIVEAGQEYVPEKAAVLLKKCEQKLINDCVVTPLYTTMSHYAVAPNIEGLRLYPYSDRLYFKYAQINK